MCLKPSKNTIRKLDVRGATDCPQMLFFYPPLVFLNIYGLCSYMCVRIGQHTLGLGVEHHDVVSPTASHHPLVETLDKLEEKFVPSQFQRHGVKVVHLDNVVADEKFQVSQYLPHHLQTTELAPTHIPAHINVAWTVPYASGRHQCHLVSQLLKPLAQRAVHKTRFA